MATNSIVNMATDALKIAVLLLFVSTNSYSQKWTRPPFYFIETDPKTGQKYDFHDYLDRRDLSTEDVDSLPTWGVFFFRVNTKGKVDSIFHQGTLKVSRSNEILENIKATSGKWKTNQSGDKLSNHWFIYPTFEFGKDCDSPSAKCSVVYQNSQKDLKRMASTLGSIFLYSDNKKAYLISPRQNGGGYSEH